MPQQLTARNSVVAHRIYTLLSAFIDDDDFFDPPIQDVFYGDQIKLPRSPAICVEPGTKRRTWPPTATDRTENELEVVIMIYMTDQTGDVENIRYLTDQLSETVEEYLNVNHRHLRDASGNDLVIYSYVTSNESGTIRKPNLTRAARLTWRGLSKTRLTQAQ